MLSMWVKFRNIFLTGLMILLPLAGSLWVLKTMLLFFDGLLGDYISPFVGQLLGLGRIHIPGLGILLTVTATFVIGLIATNVFGKRLIGLTEKIFMKTPIVKSIYMTLKQFLDAFVQKDQRSFNKVVLIEYPRKGIYVLALAAAETKGEVARRVGKPAVNVFLPTTPNPTSGFMLVVPLEDVTYLDMSVEEAMRLIISGGVISSGEEKKEDVAGGVPTTMA